MSEPDVVVVGETPSLGHAIVDLLESDRIDCRYVADLAEGDRSTVEGEGHRLIIAASNKVQCPTARRWIRGELPHTELVVVGSRDPELATAPGVHLLRLPLPPRLFLRLIHDLIGGPGGSRSGSVGAIPAPA